MIVWLAALIIHTVHAADFTSAFLGFEMPDGFTCKKNSGTYICMSNTGAKMKDEIIVVSFKRAGPQDALEQYRTQMRQPRTIRDKNKMNILSQVLNVEDFTSQAVPWVEARHANSEIENYLTSYWVTRVGGVGMLISYSAHQNKKSEWERNSQRIRGSLSVDSVAAEAAGTPAQIASGHPDLDEAIPSSGNVKDPTDWRPVETNKSTWQKLMAGTVTIGGTTLKKSSLILIVSGIAALAMLFMAIRR